ncbi:MAG: glycerol kinase [Kiritimatiellia bacterium]|jgi:hypothetical protein|nr:glycerol kinase [Kiritimatiellia bacterium]MDP6810454.1 glycerol kinase [Kiritimatiellia bacterium]MDP7024525.1 glycerol kinase [Kiritimatiellia bacterium]
MVRQADDGLLSTSKLAKHLGISSRDLFAKFEELGWITGEGKSSELTDAGKAEGGQYLESPKYGRWIAWPEAVVQRFEVVRDKGVAQRADENAGSKISSTALGQHFGLSPQRMNSILSELGWIQKGDVKGWLLTPAGQQLGGMQKEHPRSGVPYAVWPPSLTENARLVDTVGEQKGEVSRGEDDAPTQTAEPVGFREKFKAKHRTTDGHYVRSKAEMLVDNWLYMAEIVHAYERRLPIEEEVYSDFYIPTGKVYIEYWGLEGDPKYEHRKQTKLGIYEKYGFNLIELNEQDVQNLDDILPAKLLRFGVQSY